MDRWAMLIIANYDFIELRMQLRSKIKDHSFYTFRMLPLEWFWDDPDEFMMLTINDMQRELLECEIDEEDLL